MGGTTRLRWATGTGYDLSGFLAAFPVHRCWRRAQTAYSRFQQLYGIDISKGLGRSEVTPGANFHLGAYELASSGGPTTTQPPQGPSNLTVG